jgi:hypothetical protein
MISADAELRDFLGERLHHLSGLLSRKHGESPGSLPIPPGVILLRSDDGLPAKILHTRLGRIAPGSIHPDELTDLPRLANRLEARWIVSTEGGALTSINETASADLRPGQDMVDFWLCLARAAACEIEAGRITYWPDPFEGIALPSREALDRAFDALLPPNSSALLYVFDGPSLYAEAIVVRGSREIELVAGHDALEIGPPPLQWREGYRDLLKAAEARLAKPSVGVFVTLEAARAIASGKRSGELPKALARRELIVEPAPYWLAGPLGAVAVRDAVEVGRKARAQISERLDHAGLGGRLFKRGGRLAGQVGGALADRLRQTAPMKKVEERVSSIQGPTDFEDLLGFDPFMVARKIREI